MEFAKYAEVPNNIGEELLAKAAKAKEDSPQVNRVDATCQVTEPGSVVVSRSAALVLALVAGTASAAPKRTSKKPDLKEVEAQQAEAKQHIAAATVAHAAGTLDVALTELRAAYNLDPSPTCCSRSARCKRGSATAPARATLRAIPRRDEGRGRHRQRRRCGDRGVRCTGTCAGGCTDSATRAAATADARALVHRCRRRRARRRRRGRARDVGFDIAPRGPRSTTPSTPRRSPTTPSTSTPPTATARSRSCSAWRAPRWSPAASSTTCCTATPPPRPAMSRLCRRPAAAC